jgi:hypothetical protein
MKIKILFLLLLVFSFLYSCSNEDKDKEFWVVVQVLKELKYQNLTVNNITYDENKEAREEYTKKTPIHMFDPDNSEFTMFFMKLSEDFAIDDLKDYKIEIKNNDEIIWTDFAYNENEFSKCGFYQMKDEPDKDKIKEILFSFIEKDVNSNLILEGKYYSDIDNNLICDGENPDNNVMIAINVANNVFMDYLMDSVNDIELFNNIENDYIWKNYNSLVTKSGYDLFRYKEDLRGYEKNSAYTSFMVKRDELKDYYLKFKDKNGLITDFNLSDIQFCGVPNEKSFDELIPDFKILTYGFNIKDGIPKLEFRGALNNDNNFVNCSKVTGESSSVAYSADPLLIDTRGEININEVNGEPYSYIMSDNYLMIEYFNLVTNPDEYKESGLKRWGLGVLVPYTMNTDFGFQLLIPWHLVKEGGTLTLNSDILSTLDDTEVDFWAKVFRPVFYNSDFPIEFSASGLPIINYGDNQELIYHFNHVPSFYGDYLDVDFSFLAKEGDIDVINYKGNIKSQYFGNDIFHCFSEDKLWICPKEGFEGNFLWINK